MPERWVMPEWMKGYENEEILGPWDAVAKLMNTTPDPHDILAALLCTACKARVRLLETLHERGLLREVDSVECNS